MTNLHTWDILISSLFDDNGINKCRVEIPGSNLYSWLELVQCDRDDIDKFLLDIEVLGG